MNEHMKDAFGGMLVMAIWLTFFLLPGSAQAGGLTLNLKHGEGLRLQCSGGTIAQNPKSGSTVAWTCQKSVGPPDPDPTPPPSTCGNPDLPIAKYAKLKVSQDFDAVKANEINVYHFQGSRFSNGGVIDIAPSPVAAPTSNSNLTVISECNGDIAGGTAAGLRKRPRGCWATGNQNSFQIQIGTSSSTVCGIAANKTYYVNTTPRNPLTGKNTCRQGRCGIVIRSAK